MRFLVLLLLAQAPAELPSSITAAPAHLFPLKPARAGGEPAVIEYWLDGPAHRVQLSVTTADGRRVATLAPPRKRGVNRARWDLRIIPPGLDAREIRREGPKGLLMPLALPAQYVVRLNVDGVEQKQPLELGEDPRLQMTPDERRAWTELQVRLWQTAFGAEREKETVTALAEQALRQPGPRMKATADSLRKLEQPLERMAEEVEALLRKLTAATTPVSAADAARAAAFAEALEKRRAEVRALRDAMRARPQ